jgi:hypothetical protein
VPHTETRLLTAVAIYNLFIVCKHRPAHFSSKGGRMIQTFDKVTGNRLIGGLINISIAITLTFVLAACSTTPPKAQVQNNAANNASVQFKAENGSIVNINDVAPGTTSLTSEISKGSNTVISDVASVRDTDAVTAATHKLYTAVIDSFGKLTVQGK